MWKKKLLFLQKKLDNSQKSIIFCVASDEWKKYPKKNLTKRDSFCILILLWKKSEKMFVDNLGARNLGKI